MLRRAAAIVLLGLAASLCPASTLSIVSQVSQESYTNFLGSLYTQAGYSRAVGGSQHDLALANIYSDFFDLSLNPVYDAFLRDGVTYTNVVATLPGTKSPDEIYVVSGHYDSSSSRSGGAASGADDDASGIAGVLEAARVLSQHAFEATIVFIAFDGEELGLYGSAHYAAANSSKNIKGALSLDMISYNRNGANQAWVIGQSNDFRDAVLKAVDDYSSLTPVDKGTWMDCCSDQKSFENYGFPGALLIEYDPLNNSNYHTSADSVSTSNYIDYAYATDMTRAAVGFLADQAGEVPEPSTAALFVCAAVLVFATMRVSKTRSRPFLWTKKSARGR